VFLSELKELLSVIIRTKKIAPQEYGAIFLFTIGLQAKWIKYE
jgi:hypothetical protein